MKEEGEGGSTAVMVSTWGTGRRGAKETGAKGTVTVTVLAGKAASAMETMCPRILSAKQLLYTSLHYLLSQTPPGLQASSCHHCVYTPNPSLSLLSTP